MYLKSFPARIGIRPNIKITVKRTCGVLNRLFTFARLFGSQPSSHAINNDFVAQEKVELMLVANAKRPAPTIKATYIDGGNIALATSANGFPAVCSIGKIPTATIETNAKNTAATAVLNIMARGRSHHRLLQPS